MNFQWCMGALWVAVCSLWYRHFCQALGLQGALHCTPQAFNCIPPDIHIAKTEAYGFSENLLVIFIPEASETIRKH